MPSTCDEVVGAVLCGGASTRMGADKALLEIDGIPMARRVADAMVACGVRRIAAVGGDARAGGRLGLISVADSRPGNGPLAGIRDSIGWSDEPMVLVVACDLLDPDPVAMRATIDALIRSPDALVAVPVVDGQRHWVHAAWRRTAISELDEQIERGERAIWRAVGDLPIVEVHDVAAAALADADQPDDLRGCRRSRLER